MSKTVVGVNKQGAGVFFAKEDQTAITRRDHFAMAALAALYSTKSGRLLTDKEALFEDAELFYEIADAMEAARNKDGGE